MHIYSSGYQLSVYLLLKILLDTFLRFAAFLYLLLPLIFLQALKVLLVKVSLTKYIMVGRTCIKICFACTVLVECLSMVLYPCSSYHVLSVCL